ncbi:phage holin [Anaerovorax sp. IOR16]|uniref:phage holin n=1 Tax=Anaerovorax sp. IOR16 TaxID=2773458 RepID=UPI0019D0BCB8|nr:phage holin [Anaerovorax sp. IOR16]
MEQILLSLLTLVLAIATYIFKSVIVPYMESKVKKNDLEKVLALVKIAVAAAEQIYKESKVGRQKKEYVKKYLALLGIELSEAELNGLIESAVYELNQTKTELIDSVPTV